MAFPARTFRRLRRYHFDYDLDAPQNALHPSADSRKPRSIGSNETSVEFSTAQKCSNKNYYELIAYGEMIYYRYQDSANVWTWLFSFIPGTSFYVNRTKLEVVNRFLQRKIQENFAKRQASVPDPDIVSYEGDLSKKAKIKIFSYQKKSITYFPGWTKTLIVILLAVLMIGLVLTGVGALASLGVLGATASGAMVSSGIVFGQTVVGSFLFSLTTSAYFIGFGSAVAGVAASLLFHEWLRPGYLLRFIPFVGHHATQINTKYSLMSIWDKVLFSQEIKEQKYSKSECTVVVRWSPGNFIRFLSNPLRWVEAILQLAQSLVFRVAEIKSERNEASSFWRAALKQVVGEYMIGLALAPISFVKYITDIPFFVVKSVIDLPRTLYKTTCGEMPKQQRDEIPAHLRVLHPPVRPSAFVPSASSPSPPVGRPAVTGQQTGLGTSGFNNVPLTPANLAARQGFLGATGDVPLGTNSHPEPGTQTHHTNLHSDHTSPLNTP
jgi:hypothetical protein